MSPLFCLRRKINDTIAVLVIGTQENENIKDYRKRWLNYKFS